MILIIIVAVLETALSDDSEGFVCSPVINIYRGSDSTEDVATTGVPKDHDERIFVNISALIQQFENRLNFLIGKMESKEKTCDCLGNGSSENLLAKISNILDLHDKKIEYLIHNFTKPRDCEDILESGFHKTSEYTIYPQGARKGVSVRCDMDTGLGGWTVIQRRINDSDFYKTWREYQIGFGDLSSNFWLGNDNIHLLTSQGSYKLRVDLTSTDGETAYAEYESFKVGDSASKYKLTVSEYSGTAGDSLIPRGNGMKFSTKDQDNDIDSGSCAVLYLGAWWYDKCHTSNLNGDYGNTNYGQGPLWYPWKGYYSPMKTTEMKIRRN